MAVRIASVRDAEALRTQGYGNRIWKGINMLYWAAMFFVIAIVAAVFGFGGIASGAASIAKILFFVFLVLFVVSLIVGTVRGRVPR